jgi:single-strand DNA-binding protein
MAGKSLNRVQLIGNLGKDPEIKYTPTGTAVAKITIATNERFKDKSGEWQDRTEWHNVVLWQRLAEIAGEYLKKGGKVYVEGRLQTRSWDDKTSGQKKYMTEVVASDLILLGGRGEGAGGGDFSGGSRRETISISARRNRSQQAQARSVTKIFPSELGLHDSEFSHNSKALRSQGFSVIGSKTYSNPPAKIFNSCPRHHASACRLCNRSALRSCPRSA